MKSHYLFLGALLLMANVCFAQDSVKTKPAAESQKAAAVKDPCVDCLDSLGTCALIYDAKCRRFFYKNKGGAVKPLEKLGDFVLRYKQPFHLQITNLNRYLYSVNLGNSDVTFTSNQSAIMREYLLQGSSDSPPAVPNTFADGRSGNEGDQIFALLSYFKPELDRVLVLVDEVNRRFNNLTDAINSMIAATEGMKNKALQALTAAPAGQPVNTAAIEQIKILNNYSRNLDVYAETLKQAERQIAKANSNDEKNRIYSNAYLPALNKFQNLAEGVIGQIENNSHKKGYSSLLDSNFVQFKASVNALGQIKSGEGTGIGSARALGGTDTVRNAAKYLVDEFKKLEDYYNRFVDDKISAYSICTDHFKCCAELDMDSTFTYSYFNLLLSKITDSYRTLRLAANQLPEITDASISPSSTFLSPTAAIPKPPDIMKVTAADFTFDKEGKITGIKLDQSGAPVKPEAPRKKPDEKEEMMARIDSLGALWYAFEKSVSPDFIMRRILFRRNKVKQNMQYTSPPIYPYGDRMRLVFNIVATDSARKQGVILDEMTTESLDFMVRGRPTFSFSAGTFVGFGEKLRPSTYEFRQVPAEGSNTVESGSPYKLVTTGQGSIPIGASALGNITGYIEHGFRLGGSIGVGVTVAPDIKVAYLGGVTASLGTYHQFHFTLGATAMNVNELKDNYRNSTALYTAMPSGSVYNQKVQPGFFFSVSYTVFNIKASSNGQDGIMNRTGIMVK
ncbi:hypothetical protein ACWKWU_10590 [Chitinophaga lutea]